MQRLLVFLLLIQPAFAGSFYASIFLPSASSVSVADFLKKSDSPAFLISSKSAPTKILVLNEILDSQDNQASETFCISMSKSLKTRLFYVLNHDSDILLLQVYENGTRVFSYDSAPGYFAGKDEPPKFNKSEFENLVKILGVESKTKDLHAILIDRKVTIAEDRHKAISNLLSLPSVSVGLGYRYLKEDSSILPELHQLGYQTQSIDMAEADLSTLPPPDKAKAAKIMELLKIQGTLEAMKEEVAETDNDSKKLALQTLSDYKKQFSDANPAYLRELDEAYLKFVTTTNQTKFLDKMINLWVALYASQLSDQDIENLLAYYKSPLGQKDLSASKFVRNRWSMEVRTLSNKLYESANRAYFAAARKIQEKFLRQVPSKDNKIK